MAVNYFLLHDGCSKKKVLGMGGRFMSSYLQYETSEELFLAACTDMRINMPDQSRKQIVE